MAAGADLGVPSRVECLQSRIYAESALGHDERAIALAREALQKLETAGIASGEQHRLMRSVLSQVLAAAGRQKEALAVAQPLLAESTAAQGRGSIAVLRRSSVVTTITRLGGDPLAARALSDADRADAARVLGPDNQDVGFALAHARVLRALGRASEAIPLLVRAGAEARRSSRMAYVLWAGIDEANARLDAGDARGANALWNELAPLRAKAVAEKRPEEIDLLLLEARLAAARADTHAQTALLDAAQARIDAADGAANPRAFALALARGEALLASTAPLAVAEQALAAARAVSLDPARSSLVGQALLLKAKALARAGHADDARTTAADAARQLAATLGDAHPAAREATRLAAAR